MRDTIKRRPPMSLRRSSAEPAPRGAASAHSWLGQLVCTALLIFSNSEAAAQTMSPHNNMPEQHRAENGLPSASASDRPLRLTLTYGSDVFALALGGERPGVTYSGRIGFIADADLQSLVGWREASAHLSVHAIHGVGLSQHRIGNLLPTSGLEAEPAFRLFNLWIEQKAGITTLRIGQFTAGQEFAISPTAGLFVNSTFGWPGSFANDLPSGGAAYPLAAPGARLAVQPAPSTTLRLAIFAGDPAGPGGGDPQRRDLHGLNGLRLAGRPFVIGEIERDFGRAGDTKLIVGGWIHFDRFADLRVDAQGRSLADPNSSAPRADKGNFNLYAILDAGLWHSGRVPARSLRGFVRGNVGPDDRNLVSRYFDAGVTLTAPFATRSKDSVGLAVGSAWISPGTRDLARDFNATATSSKALPQFEMVAEVSYKLQIYRNLSFQPNAQYIIHPGAHGAASIGIALPDPGNALVFGLRTSAQF
ncbi:MAG: carbohydrate porin [Bradyrhizobium sp.]|nr:carbohydrate porin [Bradyrhizobium sp.]